MGQRYRIRHEGKVSKVHGIGDESGPATVGSAHVGCGEDQFDFELNIGTVLSHSGDTATEIGRASCRERVCYAV